MDMKKMMKNGAIGVCPITGRTQYEYIIFDTKSKTKKKVKLTFLEALEYNMTRVNYMDVVRLGYNDFVEV